MAGRIRSIKPEILEDEIALGLSDAAWRLWVSAWVLADDAGRFRVHPRALAPALPHASWEEVRAALEELVTCKGRHGGLVMCYEVHGQQYARITGWAAHQKIDRPSKPRCPAPPEESEETHSRDLRETLASPREDGASLRGTLATDLRPPTSDRDQDRSAPAPQLPLEPAAPAEESPPRRWPAAIACTADLETATASWGWSVQLRAKERAAAYRITQAGPITKAEIEEAKPRADGKGAPVAYFLRTVEELRREAHEEARRPTPAARPPPKPRALYDASVVPDAPEGGFESASKALSGILGRLGVCDANGKKSDTAGEEEAATAAVGGGEG